MDMSKHLRTGLVILMSLCSLSLYGGQKDIKAQLRQDLLHMNEYMSRLPAYSALVIYKVYTSHALTEVNYTEKGSFSKIGKQYHGKALGMETFSDESMKIMIDTSARVLLLSKPDPSFSLANMTVNLDQVLPYADEVRFEQGLANDKVYRLKFREGASPYAGVDLHMDASANVLKKIIVYFREETDAFRLSSKEQPTQPALEITISAFNTNPSPADRSLSASRFVVKDGRGELVPASKYSRYKVINHLKLTK